MKRLLAGLMILPFLSFGCADKELQKHYYDVEQTRTNLLIESAERQAAENAKSRTYQMTMFSNAASNAARTPDHTDDALLAFAWGYQMGQPQNITLPKLQSIKAPDSNADMVRAWTPIVGMAVPFLYPIAYGWSSGGGNGAQYTATDNAKINISSENAGSFNAAGNDMDLTSTDNRIQLEDDCINCDGDNAGGAVNPVTSDPEQLPTDPEEGEPEEEGGELCTEETWYMNPVTGIAYTDSSQTCSCGSRAAGDC